MKYTALATGILCTLLMMGCSNMRNELGLGRYSPDEFAVVKRAPLTLPPDYNLRPPSEDGVNQTARTASEEARTAVFGGQNNRQASVEGNEVLLSKMGAKQADPNIRRTLDREGGYIPVEDRSTIDKILRRPADGANSVVDAKAEAARIEQNRETGADVTTGDTPVIQKRKRNGIF